MMLNVLLKKPFAQEVTPQPNMWQYALFPLCGNFGNERLP
jgi:hypothetical protein